MSNITNIFSCESSEEDSKNQVVSDFAADVTDLAAGTPASDQKEKVVLNENIKKSSMDFSKALNEVNVGVCIKDTGKRVLFQNEVSKELCDDKSGQLCSLNCVELDKEMNGVCHTSMKNQVKFKDKFVNAVFHKDGNQITTFMFPTNQIEIIFQKPEIMSLSKREQEVVRMILMGHSNNEIAEKLYISRLTVKTHINNIYKKIPQDIKDMFPRTV